jgi:hypothetical protein
MNKSAIYIAGAIVLAGCASPGHVVDQHGPAQPMNPNVKNECDGDNTNKIMIKIGYGDSYLEADPNSQTKRKGEIVYKLEPRKNQPSGIDYTGVIVTIEGKRDPEDQWLNKVAAAGTGSNKIYICVPPAQPNGDYGFNVTVPGVGTIDPRVRVEN